MALFPSMPDATQARCGRSTFNPSNPFPTPVLRPLARRVFTIRVSVVNQKVKIGFFCMEGGLTTFPTGSTAAPAQPAPLGGSGGWVPGRPISEAFAACASAIPLTTERTPIRAAGEDGFFLARPGGRMCRFTKLTAPRPVTKVPSRPAPEAAALGLCGLWCAPYGSHGLEIIHLSVESPAQPAAPVASEGCGARAKPAVRSRKANGGSCRSGSRAGSGSVASSQNTASSNGSVCTSSPASEDTDRSDCCSADSDSSDDDEDDDGEYMVHFSNPAMKTTTTTKVSSAAAMARDCPSAGGYTEGEDDGDEDEEMYSSSGSGSGGCNVGEYQHRQLFGAKVTGDANVPAGKVSFAVDLEKVCDVDDELEADSRPVILFLPSGAVMANLSNRRGSIAFWRKGRGQINRVPGRWCPEWVDVDFLVYQTGSRCAFSVLFRQPTEAVRVIIDFEPVLGTKEEWPQWPTSTATSIITAA